MRWQYDGYYRIRPSHTGGQPLGQHALLQYERAINCNSKNITVPMKISVHHALQLITMHSVINWFIYSLRTTVQQKTILSRIIPVKRPPTSPTSLMFAPLIMLTGLTQNSKVCDTSYACSTNRTYVAICLQMGNTQHSILRRHRIASRVGGTILNNGLRKLIIWSSYCHSTFK